MSLVCRCSTQPASSRASWTALWITKPAGFTANVDILQSEDFITATTYNGPFAESLDYVRDFWNVPIYNQLLAAAQRHIGEALDGVAEPEAALTALANTLSGPFHR